jgi:hypothetical protein
MDEERSIDRKFVSLSELEEESGNRQDDLQEGFSLIPESEREADRPDRNEGGNDDDDDEDDFFADSDDESQGDPNQTLNFIANALEKLWGFVLPFPSLPFTKQTTEKKKKKKGTDSIDGVLLLVADDNHLLNRQHFVIINVEPDWRRRCDVHDVGHLGFG